VDERDLDEWATLVALVVSATAGLANSEGSGTAGAIISAWLATDEAAIDGGTTAIDEASSVRVKGVVCKPRAVTKEETALLACCWNGRAMGTVTRFSLATAGKAGETSRAHTRPVRNFLVILRINITGITGLIMGIYEGLNAYCPSDFQDPHT
jgi:hypothetical protein